MRDHLKIVSENIIKAGHHPMCPHDVRVALLELTVLLTQIVGKIETLEKMKGEIHVGQS